METRRSTRIGLLCVGAQAACGSSSGGSDGGSPAAPKTIDITPVAQTGTTVDAAGGTQIVPLDVTKAGTSDLTGMYRQQWNSPSPDAQPDFSMTVKAE